MKFARLAPILLFLFCACHAPQSGLPARLELSRAIASALPELLRARYVLKPSAYTANPSQAPAPLLKALLASGFNAPGKGKPPQPAWSALAQKSAFFSDGWIWISDATGKSMRSVWFEPDLRAEGLLEWSDDSTQLRLKADGWRRWVYLDLELENPLK